MPGGTQVPSCNTSDVAVCFDWPKDTSRDLIFSGFEESSVGVYECRIASIIQFPKSINITVLDPPNITRSPKSKMVAFPNTQVTLSCEAVSMDGSVQYHWESRGFTETNWTVEATVQSTSFSTKPSESRQYRCVAANDAGNVTSDVANVTVLKIVGHPQTQTVGINSTVRFTCTSSMSNDLIFSWTHNSRLLEQDNILKGDTSTIEIVGADKSNDGRYVCIVSSGSLMTLSNTATLTVITDPPVITVHPLGGYIPLGHYITLRCEANGLGLLVYTWERRQSNQDWTVISSDSLTTYNTTTNGFYRCRVENEAGSVVSNETQVHVYGPPTFLVHPVGGDIPMGYNVTLECEASGRGLLAYLWEKRESGGDWTIVDDSNTTTYTTSISGLYQCNVSNEAGSVVSNSATVNVYGPPEIINHPISDYVPMGRNITLMCRASGLGTLVYSWERRSSGSSWTTVSNDNTISYTTDTTLTIGEYMYRCNVSNEAGSVVSNRATVNVYGSPGITDHPTGGDVPMGRSITLMCRASGLGILVYSWERRSSGSDWTTVSNDNTTSYTTDTTLTIGEYMYRCRVSNEAGSTVSNGARVDNYGVPIVTVHPSDHLATVDMDVALNCEGSGKGMLIYQWENNVDNSWSTVTNSNNKTYKIENIQESEGYRCVVGNEVGNVTSNPAMITILEITTHPQDRLVPVGSSVNLTCTSSVSSNVTFSWTSDGRDVTGQSTSTGDTSILTITSVRSSDDGSYVCNVRSGSLSVISNTANLTVYGSPVITTHPSSIDVPVGNNFTLSCQAGGHGSLLFSWEKFSGGSWHVVDNTTEYTASIKTDGQVTYRCTVTNEAGSVASDIANINVYGPPIVQELPQQVHVVLGEEFQITCTATNHKNSPMNMTFSWKTPNGVEYNYTTTDEDDSRTASSILHINRVVHSGGYKCIAGIGGTINASVSTNIVVEVHSSRPQHLSIISEEVDSLMLKWRNPVQPRGIVDHFKVYYNHTNHFEYAITTLINNTYTLDNLRPYTEYSVYVTAVRLIGTTGRSLEGEKSRTVTGRTLAGKPVIVTVNEDRRPNKTINFESVSERGHTIVVELPTITAQNGPFSYLYIIVHMASDQLITDPESISTQQLLRESTKTTPLFYVAAVVNASQYVPDYRMSYILGAGDNTTDSNGRVFYNREVIQDTVLLFYRVFSVSSTQQQEISTTTNVQTRVFPTQQDVSGSDDSSGTGLVIGAIIAVLVIVILVIVVVIVFLLVYRSRHSDSIRTSKSSSTIDDSAIKMSSVDKESASCPTKLTESAIMDSVNPAFKIKLELSEVNSCVGQPTTLPIGLPNLYQPEVTWMKDEKPVTHPILPDGSLYIINTDIHDQGDYTVTVSSEGNTVSAMLKLTVTNPKLSTNDSHQAVKVDNFAEHLAMLKASKSAKLEEDFQKVSLDLLLTQHAAKLSCNKTKNRFINIMPYDHSRVVLSPQDQLIGSDYINASYINGYKEPKAYIAAQGPVINSLNDFWRMIWEHNIKTIVMLTRLVEDSKIKCRQYWPDSGSTTYGSINVILHKEENRAYYSIRHFHVKKVSDDDDDNEVRVICQLHFTGWPDHGVPNHATALLDFQRIVNDYHYRNTAKPMLVHCSAGVGRTGTFIAIDSEIQRIQKESVVNVFDCVHKMRYQRNHMVQTMEQYTFIYTALLEYITCGNTSICGPVKSAIVRVDELFTVNPSAEKSELQLQFEKLMMIKETLSCTTTSPRCSIDCTEMVLHKPDGSSDHLNAFYINGYHKRKAFIVAPEPIQSTAIDFWTMVWENKSQVVILLGQLTEDEEKVLFNCCNENLESESFVSEITSVETLNEEIVQRNIKLTNTRENMSRTITHFQYVKWSQHSCPISSTPVVDMIKVLERIQGNGPITVHCSDDIGCCGTLCALIISINQFKTEQLFNVFKTVHVLQSQKLELVENLEQYEYIHRALVAVLQET
ncbi:receptor-type tyrosine-protein phosphatase S-like isoform X3 [Dysidea avara]